MIATSFSSLADHQMAYAAFLGFFGIVAHQVGDWLLQNRYIGQNKTNLRHPASWLHALIHGVLAWLVFQSYAAMWIGAIHLIIDTRYPLVWLAKVMPMPEEDPMRLTVLIGRDQALHLVVIAICALSQAMQ